MTDYCFDYEYYKQKCQFPVGNNDEPCDEIAIVRCWWNEDEEMHVCQEHLNFIKESEEVWNVQRV
jgi:hypothetical protein